MAVTYGFFDSIQGDRVYDADDISNYFLKLISNGVFATPSNAMQVQANSGMQVAVSAGWGFINCKWVNNSTAYLLTVDTADVSLNRIDRVVLRLDKNVGVRRIDIAVKTGTPAANPTAPTLTRQANGIWELSLAQIYVGADVSEITQADITDERPNTELCGFITGLIDQIDTTNLFAQFTNAFETWFSNIQQTIQATNMIEGNRYVVPLDEDGTLSDFEIPNSNYNYTLDVLHVYINGMLLTPDVDYHEGHSSTATNIVLLRDVDVIGTVVEYEVLKGVDGTGAETVVSQVTNLRSDINALSGRLNNLSFMKCTQSYYDSISHNANTIYFIVD